ncbi:MAG: regulatory protein RecX [Bacteroidia bacterium]
MDQEVRQKKYTPIQAKLKAESYCAYQERCQQEIRRKLSEWGVWGLDAEEIILHLINENFLNEERFAKAYAGGKFRTQHWGRVRIKRELKQREISEYCIKQAMKEIDEDDYMEVIKNEAEKKMAQSKLKLEWQKKQKVAQYLVSRGFETDLVWQALK